MKFNLRSSLVGACLLYASLVVPSRAQDLGAAPFKIFTEFAERQQLMLSKLKTFEMKGSIKITLSDEYLKRNEGDVKVRNLSFHVTGKGDSLKQIVQRQGEHGNPTSTYYVRGDKFVCVQSIGGSSMAAVYTLGKKDNIGLLNECPSFLEYSFLGLSITNAGIRASSLAELTSKERWAQATKNLRSLSLAPDGSISIVFPGSTGKCSVTLVGNDETAGYKIGTVNFFNEAGALDRRVQVLEMFNVEQIGIVGKKYKVSIFRTGSEASAVWEYQIDDVKINAPIDDESFDFDPVSVEAIYDGDHNVTIKVPK